MTTPWTPQPPQQFEPPTGPIPSQNRPNESFGPPPTPIARDGFSHGALVLAGLLGLLVGAGLTAAIMLFGTGAQSVAKPSTTAVAAPPSTRSSTMIVVGSLTLSDTGSGSTVSGMTCSGAGGFSDISGGSSVTIYNAAGTVVATGSLGPGAGSSGSCVFPFSVANVPTESDFYRIEISHRGQVTYSRADVQAGVSMSLGTSS